MSSSQDSHSPDEVEKTSSQHTNKEGTLYQSELGPKAHRKHFFSPLDPAHSDAVHRDAESVEYTEDEEVEGFSFWRMMRFADNVVVT